MSPDMKNNLRNLPTNYTTWVVGILGALVAWWVQLPPSTQAEYLVLYPWLKYVAPLAAAASFVIARVLPQGAPPLLEEPPAEKDPLLADTQPLERK